MKKILFATQQFGCGGVEKALINLLKLIDREKYDCELLLISNKGEFRKELPEWLAIVEYRCPEYVKELAAHYKKPELCANENIKIKTSKIFWILVYYANKLSTKIFKKNISYRIIYEKYKKYNKISDYDAIVDFHGYGVYTTYLVAQQKEINKKISWIHEETIYREYKYISCCYRHFEHIFGVSLDCCNNFVNEFRTCKDKVSVYYNYINTKDICEKALIDVENSIFGEDNFKIVSVGRVNGQKAFDRAIIASQILRDKGYKFKWIIVGDGIQLEEFRIKVKEQNLENVLCFIGFDDNPYKYIKRADLYVQTSRVEGLCTTISEAIVLGKAIVSTRVGGIEEQLDGGKGGIIVEHTSEDIASAVEKMIDNKELLREKENYNQSKHMDFAQEIEKLYLLLDR